MTSCAKFVVSWHRVQRAAGAMIVVMGDIVRLPERSSADMKLELLSALPQHFAVGTSQYC
jgi:hypothetical protein